MGAEETRAFISSMPIVVVVLLLVVPRMEFGRIQVLYPDVNRFEEEKMFGLLLNCLRAMIVGINRESILG